MDEIERYKMALAAEETWSASLMVKIDNLTKQRDQARIELCMGHGAKSATGVSLTPQDIAKENGWDYLIPMMGNE
jgi:hypothetical protein